MPDRKTKRIAIGVLAAGSVVILLAFVVSGPLAERVFVFTGLLFPGALIALSGRRLPGRWRVGVPIGLTVWLEACAAAILFGVGPSALIMLFGMGLLPLVVLPLIHVIGPDS